jgi:hypothetical protein
MAAYPRSNPNSPYVEGGEEDEGVAFVDDAELKLCDAAKLALEIAMAHEADELTREAMNQAHGALARFLEGWA